MTEVDPVSQARVQLDVDAARAGGSAVGSRYRHTTPETGARIRAAINGRLTIAVDTATRLGAQAQLTPAPAGTLTAPRRRHDGPDTQNAPRADRSATRRCAFPLVEVAEHNTNHLPTVNGPIIRLPEPSGAGLRFQGYA
jgi:hypothetical protein